LSSVNKKAAIYCRVSSDDQKEKDTIENQIDILHTYIEFKQNLTIYDEYLDNGISGTIPFNERPEGSRLIADAEKGLFDTVLVWKVDRFGRDTLSGLNAVEMLTKSNIEILSVSEPFDLNTPTGRFQFITYLNMAELERNNILDRMFLGATRAAKKGKWLGGIVPYGYSVNQDGFLEINNDEAEVIRKIFSLYTKDKLSSISIAAYLNNTEIPSSCGTGKGKRTKNISGKWRSSTIQRILRSTTYKGIHEYGKRGSRRKELIVREVPAIVTPELWEEARVVSKNNSIMSTRNMKNYTFLLRGLLTCSVCGRKFYGITYKEKSSVYVCSGKRGENKRLMGSNCIANNVKVDDIEPLIVNDIKYMLLHADELISDLRRKSANSDIDKNVLDEELKKLLLSIQNLNSEKTNIYKLFRKNKISEDDLDIQLNEISKEELQLNKQINILNNKISCIDNNEALVNSFSEKLKTYSNRVNDLTEDDYEALIKLLVKSILVTPIIEEGVKTSVFKITYNLVKLESHTDTDS
jgi:site-specific DNA recombinase